jgi:hypothetical protein
MQEDVTMRGEMYERPRLESEEEVAKRLEDIE